MGRYHSTENTKPHYLMIAALAVLVFAGLFYFIQQQRSSEPITQTLDLPEDSSPAPELPPVSSSMNTDQQNLLESEPSVPTPAEVDTELTPAEPIPLPSLDQSDEPFKQDLTGLSANLNAWMNTDEIIPKYLKIINDASQGQRQFKHMRFLKPEKPFTTGQDGQGLYLDPQSYRRFDELTAAIDALDVQETLELYVKYRPLFQQVFTAFGYPEQYRIEDIFKKTASIILDAPIIENRIYLLRPTVRYKFKDNKLEQLDPLQKQMIRMGPINTRIIQHKVRLLVEALVNQESLR